MQNCYHNCENVKQNGVSKKKNTLKLSLEMAYNEYPLKDDDEGITDITQENLHNSKVYLISLGYSMDS